MENCKGEAESDVSCKVGILWKCPFHGFFGMSRQSSSKLDQSLVKTSPPFTLLKINLGTVGAFLPLN